MIVTHRHQGYQHVNRTASAQGEAELRQSMSTIEAMYSLTKSPKMAKALEQQRELLELARRPARTFSPEVKEGVTSYLSGKGPIPAGLEAPQQELLEQFGELHKRRVQFVDSQAQDLSPTEAFLALAKHDYHSKDESISIKTYQNGGIATATVRPQYLPSIKFFIDKTLEGEQFFRPEDTPPPKGMMVQLGMEPGPNSDGMIPIKTVQTFLSDYKFDPSQAVVKWGFSKKYSAISERPENETPEGQMKRSVEQLAKGIEDDLELLEFGDDFISVGGIMLDREE